MDVSGDGINLPATLLNAILYATLKFLGDGDSKAHNLLVEQAVYGNEQVQKLERVGHVQKPMGSRLQSLKGRMGQTCLEHGKNHWWTGRLSKSTIDKTPGILWQSHKGQSPWYPGNGKCSDGNLAPQNILPMITQIMIFAPLESIHGVAFSGMLQEEHRNINIIRFQRLWPMLSSPSLKVSVMTSFLHAVFMVVLKTKMRPSMPSSASVQLKKLIQVYQ